MADFNDEGKTKKISYAASVGLNDIPEDKAKIYRTLLSDFEAVSVRENIGKALLEHRCGVKSEVVLDPTLLLSAEIYEKMAKNR